MTKLQTGDIAPQFALDSTEGELSLDSLLAQCDKGVVVYFYPKANTPGCTTQACDFRDSLASLQGSGYLVVGISKDPLESLNKFKKEYSLTFPLASDPDHHVMEAYGAWGEKNTYGRKSVGVIRSTVVVTKGGKVALAQYGVKATGHVSRLRRDLGIDPH